MFTSIIILNISIYFMKCSIYLICSFEVDFFIKLTNFFTYTQKMNSVALIFYRINCNFFKTCNFLQQIMITTGHTWLKAKIYVTKAIILMGSFTYMLIVGLINIYPFRNFLIYLECIFCQMNKRSLQISHQEY